MGNEEADRPTGDDQGLTDAAVNFREAMAHPIGTHAIVEGREAILIGDADGPRRWQWFNGDWTAIPLGRVEPLAARADKDAAAIAAVLAPVIAEITACGHCDGTCGACQEDVARVLAALDVAPPTAEGSWVCGVCDEGGPAHARSDSKCVFEPTWKPAPPTADHDTVRREAAAEALREAAEDLPGFSGRHNIGAWLNARADAVAQPDREG